MLPRIDGLTVCNRLRDAGNNTPVLMLTALDSRDDMLKGFQHGADDYLTKPFDLDILEARMTALIRRYHGTTAATRLRYGEVSIDRKTRKAYRQDRLLALNPTTYTIFEMLVKHAPEVVTREESRFLKPFLRSDSVWSLTDDLPPVKQYPKHDRTAGTIFLAGICGYRSFLFFIDHRITVVVGRSCR